MNELDAIAISSGPGSYTGLRVGASLAKGICYSLDLPLISISTLESIASATRNAYPDKNLLHIPMVDARRMEVYTAGYDAVGALIHPLEAKILDKSSYLDHLDQYEKLVFSGNGSAKFAEIVDHPAFIFTDLVCSASWMVALAVKKYDKQEFIDAAYYKPEYLKAPNITQSKKKLF
jgi:tRNA threonylcarbamoyladenosine biosynthesis protein TsaB